VSQPNRVIVVDPCDATRDMLARRLQAQGYTVDGVADPAAGADLALGSPPVAVVADLWMPTISGVQLCRLLRTEPATAEVPIILCGDTDEPRNRFWAERAGANAYVQKRRTGELVRSLARAVAAAPRQDSFFFQLAGGTLDVRDRIARYLDGALFDSVIAAEVRALATCGTFERLFDLFVQFLSQVVHYRWVAVSMDSPDCLGVHHHPALGGAAEIEARAALGLGARGEAVRIEDEDAFDGDAASPAMVWPIPFGNSNIGKIGLSLRSQDDTKAVAKLLALVARELGGPIRITSLVEESQRLASTDPLTSLLNRRAFGSAMTLEVARSERHGYPLSLALLDVDHFKQVNDRRGHASGDLVLAALGGLLRGGLLRRTDLAARWGGEEFVVAYLSTSQESARVAADRLREAVEGLAIEDAAGVPIPITASIGVAELHPGDTLEALVERADKAMYASKAAGRNRVSVGAAAPRRSATKGLKGASEGTVVSIRPRRIVSEVPCAK
jgi:two-component system, cell cycle response regulator